MVLGRLFKLHPDFDIAVARILLESPETSAVVLITERISEWNEIIYERILTAVKQQLRIRETRGRSMSNTAERQQGEEETEVRLSTEEEIEAVAVSVVSKKLKYVSYARYTELLQIAAVALDTFPYGGEREREREI